MMPASARTTETAGAAIETQNLRKVFGAQTAVRDLSLTVPRGEIFGFLGPNGAGKSTSIKMLLGLVTPTSGSATMLGAPIGEVETRRRIGFLPEDFRFYDWLTAAELVHFHGRLCGMSRKQLASRVPQIIDRVGLSEHRNRPLRGFSKGMLQRIGLAQALVHEPELVFLDEPTSGLDPIGRRLVRDILREERDRGATVFLNSHILSEIEVTCNRVAFVREGAIVATRDLGVAGDDELRVAVHARNVTGDALAGLTQYTPTPLDQADRVRFSVPSQDVVPGIVRHLVHAGADVYEVTPERVPLEDIFMELMGEDHGQ